MGREIAHTITERTTCGLPILCILSIIYMVLAKKIDFIEQLDPPKLISPITFR